MLKAIISSFDTEFHVILEIELTETNTVRTLVDIVYTVEEAYKIIEKMQKSITVVYHE
jgi:hypothetical protein